MLYYDIIQWYSIMACKGICTKYKAHKANGIPRYTEGQRHCSTCEIFLWWSGKYCPCCNFVLRLGPRNSKSRKIGQDIKRI